MEGGSRPGYIRFQIILKMRNLAILLFLLIPFIGMAQNIGIGTNSPDASALLDISSTQKGLLVPRMSTSERTTIPAPAVGLVVFDNTTFSFWVYRGDINGGWQELMTTIDKHWDRLGANIYNNNNGNVGIGTNAPPQKLSINAINPVVQLINDGTPRGFLSLNGNDIKLATNPDNNTGSLVLATQGADRITVTKTGLVGIGTSTPNAMLTISTLNPGMQLQSDVTNIGYLRATSSGLLRIGTNATNTTGNLVLQTKEVDRVTVDENGLVGIGTASPGTLLTVNGTDPVVQLRNGNVDKGNMQLAGNDLRIGTNATNTTGNLKLQTKNLDRVTIDENGLVGIGTTAPTSILSISALDPIIQLKNGSIDKGFLQLVGNDLKIGTNISNSTGNFFVRTGGVDRLQVDVLGKTTLTGNMAVEKSNPTVTLSSSTGNSFITFNDATGDMTIQKTNLGGGSLVLRADGGISTTTLSLTTAGHLNFGTGLTPTGYKCSIQGKVIATDFTALPVSSWPDYVFEKNYRLRSLGEVRAFIEANNHLPGIPSAAQVEKEGIQLGDMSKRLVEKVEELTLYIIQLQEQIDALKKAQEQKSN